MAAGGLAVGGFRPGAGMESAEARGARMKNGGDTEDGEKIEYYNTPPD